MPDVRDFGGLSAFGWNLCKESGEFSPLALKLLGLEKAPALRTFIDMVHPEDRLRFETEIFGVAENGGTLSHEYRVRCTDGALVHLFSHMALQDADPDIGRVLSGVLVDVTKERSRPATAHAPGAVAFGSYEYDVVNDITHWSAEMRQMFLQPHGLQLTGEAVFRSIYPDDRVMFDTALDAAVRAVGPFEITFRVTLPDGQVRWVRDTGEAHGPLDPATGKVPRVTGTLTDVTEITDNAPLAAQEDFWNLIDRAPFGVYAVDADMRVVRMSAGGLPVFEEVKPLLGRDLSEVLHILWPASFATEAVGHFRHTLRTGEPYRATPLVELRNDRKSIESYDWGIDRMRLADGRYGVVCHFYDLTERLRHETELEQRERRLNMAYDAADMGAWSYDPQSGEFSWSKQLYRLFGRTPQDGAAGDLWRQGIHRDDIDGIDAALKATLDGGPQLDVDFRIRMSDGEIRYMAAKGELSMGAPGKAKQITGVVYDVTERKMAEHASRDSAQWLRQVLDNINSFVGVVDPDGTLREVNWPALQLGGLERADVIGQPFWDTHWLRDDPDIQARVRTACADAVAGEVVSFDMLVRAEGEQTLLIDFMLAPVFDAHGKLLFLIASGFDISQREEARAHAQSLLGEINHRTKNMLTLIQIMARQTARSGIEGFMERFETRIRALADAQDLLVKQATDTVDLGDLALSQMAHFQDLVGSRIHLSGPRVTVGPHAAQAIGMALHELATNAGKYGALSTEAGEITIDWTVEEGSRPDRDFQLRWVEKGGPTVVRPERRGFGSTVIKQMTQSNIGGEVILDYAPEGLRWQLDCPLSALTARG